MTNLGKRLALTSPPGSAFATRQNSSVRDQAELLLSIAAIASSEIKADGFSSLWEDDKLPSFPSLKESVPPLSLEGLLSSRRPEHRARAVSVDHAQETLHTVTPVRRLRHKPKPVEDVPTPGSKNLQGPPPKGAVIKMINRRKFSWKHYPEVRTPTTDPKHNLDFEYSHPFPARTVPHRQPGRVPPSLGP